MIGRSGQAAGDGEPLTARARPRRTARVPWPVPNSRPTGGRRDRAGPQPRSSCSSLHAPRRHRSGASRASRRLRSRRTPPRPACRPTGPGLRLRRTGSQRRLGGAFHAVVAIPFTSTTSRRSWASSGLHRRHLGCLLPDQRAHGRRVLRRGGRWCSPSSPSTPGRLVRSRLVALPAHPGEAGALNSRPRWPAHRPPARAGTSRDGVLAVTQAAPRATGGERPTRAGARPGLRLPLPCLRHRRACGCHRVAEPVVTVAEPVGRTPVPAAPLLQMEDITAATRGEVEVSGGSACRWRRVASWPFSGTQRRRQVDPVRRRRRAAQVLAGARAAAQRQVRDGVTGVAAGKHGSGPEARRVLIGLNAARQPLGVAAEPVAAGGRLPRLGPARSCAQSVGLVLNGQDERGGMRRAARAQGRQGRGWGPTSHQRCLQDQPVGSTTRSSRCTM